MFSTIRTLLGSRSLTDRFVTSDLGSTIVLKACGFIGAHHARILKVSQGTLKIRVGHTWIERLLYQVGHQKPVDVTLNFHEDDEATIYAERYTRPQVKQATVEVTIEPQSSLSDEEFEQVSRKLLWSLRYHFMAC